MFLSLAISDAWHESFDVAILVIYLSLAVGIPIAGYVLMAIDIRAYYRKFRGALVLISGYTVQAPAWLAKAAWSSHRQPPCVEAFDLSIPFSEAELLDAYRQRVKNVHPDRGGDRDAFLCLQRYFDEARSLIVSED